MVAVAAVLFIVSLIPMTPAPTAPEVATETPMYPSAFDCDTALVTLTGWLQLMTATSDATQELSLIRTIQPLIADVNTSCAGFPSMLSANTELKVHIADRIDILNNVKTGE